MRRCRAAAVAAAPRGSSAAARVLCCLICLLGAIGRSDGCAANEAPAFEFDASLAGDDWSYQLPGAKALAAAPGCRALPELRRDGVVAVTQSCDDAAAASPCLSTIVTAARTVRQPPPCGVGSSSVERVLLELAACHPAAELLSLSKSLRPHPPSGAPCDDANIIRYLPTIAGIRVAVVVSVPSLPPLDRCLPPGALVIDTLGYVPLAVRRTAVCQAVLLEPPTISTPFVPTNDSGCFANAKPLCFGSVAAAEPLPEVLIAFQVDCTDRERSATASVFDVAIAVVVVIIDDSSDDAVVDAKASVELTADRRLDEWLVSNNKPPPVRRSRRAAGTAYYYNPTAPSFVEKAYSASVLEEVPIGTNVTRVRAVDPDSGLAGVIRYSLEATVNQRSLAVFRIDAAGIVSVRGRLDREDMAVHSLVVKATDGDAAFAKTGTAMLTVRVVDLNDNAPVFERTLYDERVQEIEPVDSVIARVHATDADAGDNGAVRYRIVDDAGANADFAVSPELGEIRVARLLDRERTAAYSLTVEAIDQAANKTARRSSTVSVTVRVLDANDNYPVFSQSDYTFRVLENLDTSKEPTVIGLVKATDRDEGLNGAVRYSITLGNPTPPLFRIGNENGQFMVLKSLDREQAPEYTMRVRARDLANDTTPKSNVTTVKVVVLDVNDNRPIFKYDSFSFNVYENVPLRTAIGAVPATDADIGDNARLTYSIVSAPRGMPFVVDSTTGAVTTSGSVDRELVSSYSFTVSATDNGLPPLNSTAPVTITVLDVNDNVPSFSKAVYTASISEDAQVGTEVVTVVALDPDENDVVTYTIVSGDSNREFLMTREQGFGVIRVAQSLSYQRRRSYELQLVASDVARQNASCRVVVSVIGKNRFAPTFAMSSYSFGLSESNPIGTSVYQITATDDDIEENGRITYHFVPSPVKIPFKIDPDTGVISVNGTLDRDDPATQSFELDLVAEDRGTPKLSSEPVAVHIRLLDVNDNAPSFDRSSYAAEVPEDSPVGASILRVLAVDRDQPGTPNSRLRYALADGADGRGVFSMEPATGVLRIRKELDREAAEFFNLTAIAADAGVPSRSSSVLIYITVLDVNDNAPMFESAIIVRRIRENVPLGTSIDAPIKAVDADQGVNARVVYSLVSGDRYAFELVSSSDGSFTLLSRVELDYESPKKNYSLEVQAASQTLISKAKVVVRLVDANDNAPQLRDFFIIVNNYRQHFPTEVGRVPAFDPDECDKNNLRYSFKSGNEAGLLALDATTGLVRLNPHLDSDRPTSATLVITVGDGLYNATARCVLQVRLITEDMLNNSLTLRLDNMTPMTFMTDMYTYFVDALSTVLSVEQDRVYVIDIQNDTEVLDPNHPVLNVTFCALMSDDLDKADVLFSQTFLKETIYLKLNQLKNQSALTVLPFDDTLCLLEPCMNFAECVPKLRFNETAPFMNSNAMLFRPIRTRKHLTCHCPPGYFGSKNDLSCDVEVNYCYSSPCKRGGTCMQREGGYTCVCPAHLSGIHCDVDLVIPRNGSLPITSLTGAGHCSEGDDIKSAQHCQAGAVSFVPGSYVMLPKLNRRYRFKISLSFATRSQDALLLYNGRYNELHDFVSLQLVDGDLRFSYSLGGDGPPAAVILGADAENDFSDGHWHSVTIEYVNKTVVMSTGGSTCDIGMALLYSSTTQLNHIRPCAVRHTLHLSDKCADPAEQCYRFLDLTGPLMIGGLPVGVPVATSVRTDSFSGCISNVFVDGMRLDLGKPVATHNIKNGCPYKENLCAVSPCVRGTCESGWMTFVCHCPPGYGGQTCQLESANGPFGMFGNGVIRYRPVQPTVGRSWFNGLRFATSRTNGSLLKIQLTSGENITYRVVNGYVVCTAGIRQYALGATKVSDGQWHNLDVKFDSDRTEGLRLYYNLNFGQTQSFLTVDNFKIAGAQILDILVGSDGIPSNGFFGCVKEVQIGNFVGAYLNQPEMTNVEKSCVPPNPCQSRGCPPATSYCVKVGDAALCRCRPGYAGPPSCNSTVCSVANPCQNGGRCVTAVPATSGSGGQRVASAARFGYNCQCSSGFTGDYCERAAEQTCPTSWWGRPPCGPCHCDVALGFSSACNVTTGECYCQDGYFFTPRRDRCLPCDCHWPDGSSDPSTCDAISGQCRCRSGISGRRCDECDDASAELVAGGGCEVPYEACPRARADDIWWPRTSFGWTAIATCPPGSRGNAARQCSAEGYGWTAPSLDNCTSNDFAELLKQLVKLEGNPGERPRLAENTYAYTFAAKQLVANLSAASVLPRTRLYINDLNISQRAVKQILDRETRMVGLNLTHTKDRAFLHNLFTAISIVTDSANARQWRKICERNEDSVSELLLMVESYAQNLAYNLATLFAHGVMHEFDLAMPNTVIGLDTVVIDNASRVVIPKYNNYVQRPDMFDNQSAVSLPPSTRWSAQSVDLEKLDGKKTPAARAKAVVAYVLYRSIGDLLLACQKQPFVPTLSMSEGVSQVVNSPVIIVVGQVGNQTLISLPVGSEAVLTFKLLASKGRTNPRCVSWYSGAWTPEHCTLISFVEAPSGSAFVRCSCRRWGSHAVIMDITPGLEMAAIQLGLPTYVTIPVAAVCLAIALIVFCCLRASSRVSRNISCTVPIRCNMLSSMLVSLIIYVGGIDKTEYELVCTGVAVALHFSVLACLFWLLVDVIHLYRTAAEAAGRACNVDRGSMKFYYMLGYVVPGVIVALSFGLSRESYGAARLCWLSRSDIIVWSLAGPALCAVVASLGVLVAGLRLSSMKEPSQKQRRFSSSYVPVAKRSSLWSAAFLLPPTLCLWVFGFLAAYQDVIYYHHLFAACACIQGIYVLVAYIVVNSQARAEIRLRVSQCCRRQPSAEQQVQQHRLRNESLVQKQLLQLSANTCDSSLDGGLVDASLPTSGLSTVTPSQSDSVLDRGLLAYLNTEGSTSASDGRYYRTYRHQRRRHRRKRYSSSDSDSDDSSWSDTASSFRSSRTGDGAAKETRGSGERRHGGSRHRSSGRHGGDRQSHKRRAKEESSADGASHSTPSVQPHGVLPPPVHFMTPDVPSPDVVASTRTAATDRKAALCCAEDDDAIPEAEELDKLVEEPNAAVGGASEGQVSSPVSSTRRFKRGNRQPYLKSFDFI